jgi:hypothetical protein
VLWGSTVSQGNQGIPFVQGTFGAGCGGFDVSYEVPIAVFKLKFTNCGGGVVGGNVLSSYPRTASLRCHSEMQVVGVFGVYEPQSYGLPKVGLYCM